MTNKFGVFINLDYAHHRHDECSLLWKKIMKAMNSCGFIFEKRAFVITTDKTRDEVSTDVRRLFDSIHKEHGHFYSYISDSFILNFEQYSDLTLPDTSNTIDVENISYQELNIMGIEYDTLLKNKPK